MTSCLCVSLSLCSSSEGRVRPHTWRAQVHHWLRADATRATRCPGLSRGMCLLAGVRPPCWETTLGLGVSWLVRSSADRPPTRCSCVTETAPVTAHIGRQSKAPANVASSVVFSQRSQSKAPPQTLPLPWSSPRGARLLCTLSLSVSEFVFETAAPHSV